EGRVQLAGRSVEQARELAFVIEVAGQTSGATIREGTSIDQLLLDLQTRRRETAGQRYPVQPDARALRGDLSHGPPPGLAGSASTAAHARRRRCELTRLPSRPRAIHPYRQPALPREDPRSDTWQAHRRPRTSSRRSA